MNFNKFDFKAKYIIDNIKKIRSNFKDTDLILKNNIQKLQRKIKQRINLKSVLKYLETIKFLDKANSAIKNLLEKTDFKKISELLVVLNSSLNKEFTQIKIFENRYEEMKKLKMGFFETLIKMTKDKLTTHFKKIFEDFEDYLINYTPDDSELFEKEFEAGYIAEINSILIELQYFDNERDFLTEIVLHFNNFFSLFIKKIIDLLSKHLIFKKPSFNIIISFRKLSAYILHCYRILLMTSKNKMAFLDFVIILKRQVNTFLRKLFDIFDLEDIEPEKIDSFINMIIEIEGFFKKFNPEIDDFLVIYFKKVVLNARQHKFFQTIKIEMEEEEWLSVDINLNIEEILKKNFGEEISIFPKFVNIGKDKYIFSKSFFQIIFYINELNLLNQRIEDIRDEIKNKIYDLVKLYSYNCENLLLHGMALNFEKIKKINTKLLCKIKSNDNSSI